MRLLLQRRLHSLLSPSPCLLGEKRLLLPLRTDLLRLRLHLACWIARREKWRSLATLRLWHSLPWLLKQGLLPLLWRTESGSWLLCLRCAKHLLSLRLLSKCLRRRGRTERLLSLWLLTERLLGLRLLAERLLRLRLLAKRLLLRCAEAGRSVRFLHKICWRDHAGGRRNRDQGLNIGQAGWVCPPACKKSCRCILRAGTVDAIDRPAIKAETLQALLHHDNFVRAKRTVDQLRLRKPSAGNAGQARKLRGRQLTGLRFADRALEHPDRRPAVFTKDAIDGSNGITLVEQAGLNLNPFGSGILAVQRRSCLTHRLLAGGFRLARLPLLVLDSTADDTADDAANDCVFGISRSRRWRKRKKCRSRSTSY